MGKNKEMIKCFIKVMTNNEEEIEKIIPDMYAKNFYEIDIDYLKEIGINALIIDIDGTILKVDDTFVPNKLKQRFKILKENKIKLCLLSNNNEDRVKPVAKILEASYLSNARKPKKEAFDNALKILNSKKENIAMIGDQMISDIKGASEYGIYSVLVRPVDKHNNIQTGVARMLQNVMESHLKKIKKFDKNKYYRRR
ncbi:MAG: YqeG family HAD IIIA-type phosphatase [Bacilli bacterium]|nr:YqeG family HAD IIIA-type phosphatase [Bacilli bacterium]